MQTEKGNEIWLLTLSDLLMLLMIFFIVLFAMTPKPQNRVAPSLTAEMSIPIIKQKEDQTEVQTAFASPLTSKDMTSSLETDLIAILANEQGQQEMTVQSHADHLILTFPERIVFDPGRALLKPSAKPILKKVASFITTHPRLIVEVHGHTDDQPINTKRYPSNWELSVDRATMVAKSLIHLGLDPAQLSVKGFGEYRALYPNDSDLNRLKNRRVEILFFLSPQS